MAIDDLVRINGLVFSWTSCIFKIESVEYSGFTKVQYSEKRDRPKVWGSRRNGTPLGKPSGKYDAEPVQISMLIDTWEIVRPILTAKGLGSYGDAQFTFMAQYGEPGAPPIRAEFFGCTVDGESNSMQEGTDALQVDLTLGVLTAKKNGQQLWSVIRSL